MNLIEELCQDKSEDVQIKIKAAYWHGCAEGISFSKKSDRKIERKENNVIFLREKFCK